MFLPSLLPMLAGLIVLEVSNETIQVFGKLFFVDSRTISASLNTTAHLLCGKNILENIQSYSQKYEKTGPAFQTATPVHFPSVTTPQSSWKTDAILDTKRRWLHKPHWALEFPSA